MTSFDMALVDEIRKRLDASYDEVLMGLEESGGDMLRALAAIERRRKERRAAEESGELLGRALGLAREGRLKGLRVKLGDRALRDLPLPRGLGGALLGEFLATTLSQLGVELIEGEPEPPLPSQEPGAEEAE